MSSNCNGRTMCKRNQEQVEWILRRNMGSILLGLHHFRIAVKPLSKSKTRFKILSRQFAGESVQLW